MNLSFVLLLLLGIPLYFFIDIIKNKKLYSNTFFFIYIISIAFCCLSIINILILKFGNYNLYIDIAIFIAFIVTLIKKKYKKSNKVDYI